MILQMSMAVVAGLGFIVSLYAYYIERKIAQNIYYKAACDLSDVVSCSKPITSAYGKLFGISNAVLGLLYYALIIVLVLFHSKMVLYIAALIAFLFSLYLAWLLYFRIRALCILCTTTYVINIILLLLTYINLR